MWCTCRNWDCRLQCGMLCSRWQGCPDQGGQEVNTSPADGGGSHNARMQRPHRAPRAQASAITWFVVQSRLGELTPYAVRHAVQPLAALPGPGLVAELRAVVDLMAGDVARADLAGLWRPFAAIEAGAAAGGPLTRVRFRLSR